MYLLESVARPAPPPPAPPSTPVVKHHPVTQKHHNQLLQQLPKMLANGINLSRPEDYMWLDPSGRATSPPKTMSPQNKAQCTRKVWSLKPIFEILLPWFINNQINIYELISVCSYLRIMQVFSETAYSSQTKFIGQSLSIREHAIGYSNLALAANKGWKGQYSILSPWNT